MDSEEAEFIWDQLGDVSLEKRKIPKYSHISIDLGYSVFNVCMKCYQDAVKKYRNS